MGRVVIDHQIMGGAPCVAGTRIPVVTILGLLAEGMVTTGILIHYPQLTVEDVLACLRYTADVLDRTAAPPDT